VAEPWFRTLEALACEIVPSDDLPGAREAGTADAAAAALRSRSAQDPITRGLEALQRLGFADLASANRQAAIEKLTRGTPPDGWRSGDPPPEQFWPAIRGLIVALFYGSAAGRQVTGFPGPSVERGGWAHRIEEP